MLTPFHVAKLAAMESARRLSERLKDVRIKSTSRHVPSMRVYRVDVRFNPNEHAPSFSNILKASDRLARSLRRHRIGEVLVPELPTAVEMAYRVIHKSGVAVLFVRQWDGQKRAMESFLQVIAGPHRN